MKSQFFKKIFKCVNKEYLVDVEFSYHKKKKKDYTKKIKYWTLVKHWFKVTFECNCEDVENWYN